MKMGFFPIAGIRDAFRVRVGLPAARLSRKGLFLSRLIAPRHLPLLTAHLVKRLVLRKNIPAAAYLALTFKCNFSCQYCGGALYHRDGGELTIEKWARAIDQLVRLGVPRIHFVGGEPLLKAGIEELVALAGRKGAITILETNGWELTAECLRRLRRAGLRVVCVSLDGAKPDVHDCACGRVGSFQRVMEVLKLCREARMPCVLSTIARRRIIDSCELADIFALAQAEGASGVRLISPHPMGAWIQEDQEVLNPLEKKKAVNLALRSAVPLLGEGPNEARCRAAENYAVFVSPSGEIQPCGYIPYSFGNICEEDISVVLKRLSRHEMFRAITGCKIEDHGFRESYISPLIRSGRPLPEKLYG
jgi:MoaA/NifB/PqqE/SkfB family radical SAM enzyme